MGRSTIKIEWLLLNKSSKFVSLTNVLHIPGLIYNLFSISQTTRKGLKVTFLDNDYKILRDEDIIESAPKVYNTYILSVTYLTIKIVSLIN